MNQKNFQLILYVIFGILFILGFISIAIFGLLNKNDNNENKNTVPKVTIWGTLDDIYLKNIFLNISSKEELYEFITYTEKKSDTFEEEYIRAIALGNSPDIILIEHDLLNNIEQTLAIIPFNSFPKHEYQKNFIQTANILVRENGYVGIPFVIDPFVLFYNENLRLQDGVKNIPKYWSDFVNPEYINLIKKYSSLERTLIPLGAYKNYQNSLPLFLTLISQSLLNNKLNGDNAENLLTYYSNFANLNSTLYSWNVALPKARHLFVSNKLLFYPGYASEFKNIKRSNPNIAFRVAHIPQLSSEMPVVTPVKLYSLHIPKNAKNANVFLNVTFDIIGIFLNKNNDLNRLKPYQPSINNYPISDNASLNDKIFYDTRFSAKVLNVSNSNKNLIIDMLEKVIIGVQELDTAVNNVLLKIF